jgi:DNA repair exonuclease SbcCD ATPase subunit
MSENQATVQITEQNARELLAKEALIIKDYQKKLYVLKNALIDEKKKTTSLEQLSSEMKSQIKQLEEEIIHKDEEIIKLNKEIMDFQNSISLGKSKLVEEDKKTKSNIIENVIKKTKVLTLSDKNDIPNEVVLELENKKLKKKNEELESELNNIKNKFFEEKNNLEEINNKNTKKIQELNESLTSKETAIYIKNKELNENQQRIEMLINNTKLWDLEKSKFNTELKTLQDKLSALEIELKSKDEITQKLQNDNKKCTQENLELYLKIKRLNKELTTQKTYRKKYKCEIQNQPENYKAEVSFGPTGDGDYVMLLQIKEDELISMKLTDVEYIRMNKQKDALEVSVIHNENFKKFYLVHKDEIVLNYIKDAYEEYFKIAKRMEIFPEENIEIDSNKNIFDL